MSLAPHRHRLGRKATRLILGLATLATATLVPADRARASPDPEGALRALLEAPPTLLGNTLGAGGLIAAAGLGLAGDALSLIDANPATRPFLRGVVSRALRRTALGISWTATGALEGLRAEDIERLPEARATYLAAAPGVGRLDTLLDGLGAARLAVGDLFAAPGLAALRLVGSAERGRALARRRREARIRLLGPEPAPGYPAPEPSPRR